MREFRLLLH